MTFERTHVTHPLSAATRWLAFATLAGLTFAACGSSGGDMPPPDCTDCGEVCVDTDTTTAHCGACDNDCAALANVDVSAVSCVAGECVLGDTCAPGYEDCDGEVANGCETPTMSNTAHCGGCGNDCRALANVDPDAMSCVESTCVLADACAEGFGDCDGSAVNGCEEATTENTTHCGECGNPCDGDQRCVLGVCTDCPEGTMGCGGECTDSDIDDANCGSCGNACEGDESCSAGLCWGNLWGAYVMSYRFDYGRELTVNCPGGQTGDPDSVWGTGVYTDDSPVCWAAVHAGLIDPVAGGIVIAHVDAGQTAYVGTTDNGVTTNTYGRWAGSFRLCAPACGGCVVVELDDANCGECGTACTGGDVCRGGDCCPPGTYSCGGTCVDLFVGVPADDVVMHCGACGWTTLSGETCWAGEGRNPEASNSTLSYDGVPRPGTRASFVCPAGFVASPATVYGSERYLLTSTVCNAALHADVIASDAAAESIVTIELGTGLSTGSLRNGIWSASVTEPLQTFSFCTDECAGECTNTMVDEEHCGACGDPCAAGEICRHGVCEVCPESGDICDGLCTNVFLDEAHCGGCDRVCATGVCSGGVCTTTPWADYRPNAISPDGSLVTMDCPAGGMVTSLDGGGPYVEGRPCSMAVHSGLFTSATGGEVTLQARYVGDLPAVPGSFRNGVVARSTNARTDAYVTELCTELCDGACTNTFVDDANCGECGNACTGGTTCDNGVCASCTAVEQVCNGVCVSHHLSEEHCGQCGVVCGVNAVCTAGMCTNAPAQVDASPFVWAYGLRVRYDCPEGIMVDGITAYGDEIYAKNSAVCTAAVHAGVISLPQGGVVEIELIETPAPPGGGSAFLATTRNGVSTFELENDGSAFRFCTAECGGTCTNTFLDEEHCGGCDSPCDDGQTCENGTCL